MQAIYRSSSLKKMRVRSRIEKPVQTARNTRLIISTKDETFVIPYSEIKFVRADSQYSQITLSNGRTIFTSFSLKALGEKTSSSAFFRIHQSILVNVSFVRSITATHIRLVCGKELPISRRQRKPFLDFIQLQG